ncbi:serine protease 33 isoform X1 [Electrophorus electricus]|uniref:Peptidase S1 domain-containing protein n=1 Tax=Electrophorus electricus TaxID=8005 RepID=A0A4W4H2B6_ELEEL|nr:serine protease 33 isoform X1 [Electrophorus electricus]
MRGGCLFRLVMQYSCWTTFLVLVGVWSSEAQECGRPPLQSRIVGGFDASEGHWPWQVDIQTSQGHVCGGTLISVDWVLSAAHCFPNPSDTSAYIIYVGRLSLNGWNPYEMSRRITKVIVPYGYTDPQLGQDIALVQLSSSVTWSDHIQPICLPNSDMVFPPGTECTITGWGDIRDGVSLQGTGTLQQVQVPIIGQSDCQEMFQIGATEEVNIRYDMLCAGYQQGGKDSCQGDSGGPLVCQTSNGTWVQAGIVSFGLGCAVANRPGVYARVSSFSSFVTTNVRELQLYGGARQNWAGWAAIVTRTLFALTLAQLLR